MNGHRFTLGLTPAQLESLHIYLEETLMTQPCDHTLRHATTWARSQGIEPEKLLKKLELFGGYCDDEVLYNVTP